MRRILTIAVIILLAFLAAGEVSALEKAVLTGQVFDIKGNTVEGAEIFVYGTFDTRRPADFISARTDDEGRFQMNLPLNTYWVVARTRQGEKYGPLMPGDRHSGEPVEIELDHAGEFIQDFSVMDIIDAARLMKKIREDIPILIMTGYGENNSDNDYYILKKPFLKNELLGAIKKIMEKKT